MPRRTTFTMFGLAAVISVSLAALVYADGARRPAPPAPPALPAVGASAAPALPPAPPARPAAAPRALERPRTIHADAMKARIVGETLVIESEGETWVVDDPATVHRIEEMIDHHVRVAKRAAERVARMQPAIRLAEEIARKVEASGLEELGELDLDLDFELDLDMTLREVVENAEAMAHRAEVVVKAHESKIRALEAEMEEFEREMEGFEAEMEQMDEQFESMHEDLETDLERALEQALRSGKARRVD